MTLQRDGWIVDYAGSEHQGCDSGRVWFPDNQYYEACQDVKTREKIYGFGNVRLYPRYELA